MSRPNGQETVPPFTREQELHAYREMLLIRRFEEKAGAALWHGFHWRLLPFVYRPGGGRGRHEDGLGRR